MTQKDNVLTAASGKWITDGHGVFSKKVWLGTLDSADRWTEATDAEKEAWEAEQQAAAEATEDTP